MKIQYTNLLKMHAGFFNHTLQSTCAGITAQSLVYPIFVSCNDDELDEIKTLPGQYRVGKNKIVEYLQPMIDCGLKTVLLFGVIKDEDKNLSGSIICDAARNPIMNVVGLLRETFVDLIIACDVCLCGYTSHGHCGVIDKTGNIVVDATIKQLVCASLAFAKAGCHIIAPSDMTVGRTKSIHQALRDNDLREKVAIMTYSAKFASCFYGPFRDAVGSTPVGGVRKYQLPPDDLELAIQAVKRDIEEGADIVMVKPGLPYLDVVKVAKTNYPNYPVAIYQVSGEYAMLHYSHDNGIIDLKKAVFETLHCMKRAGASVFITYFAPQILRWLKDEPKT